VKTSALLSLALVPALALAQDPAATPAEQHTMVRADAIQWGDPPPALPKGAQVVVLSGDPKQAGPFAIRIKAPAGYKVPRHWHPSSEQVTIIEGDFHLSMGEAGSAHESDFKPGDYVHLPATMQHEASTKNGAIVQVNSTGPFEVNYVNPKDDPRTAGK